MFCRFASVKNPPSRFKQCIPPISHVVNVNKTSSLYQGNREAASNKKLLTDNNIKLIVNLSTHLPNYHPDDFVYHNISINDTPTEQFGIRLCDTVNFIHNFIKSNKGNVFIHCHAGISRSSTVTLAYMILHLKKKLKRCISSFKRKTTDCKPKPWILART